MRNPRKTSTEESEARTQRQAKAAARTQERERKFVGLHVTPAAPNQERARHTERERVSQRERSIRAGEPVARLIEADLRTKSGVSDYLRAVHWPVNEEPPLRAELLVAQSIARALNAALMSSDPRVWRAVRAAREAMHIDPAYVATEHLEELAAFRSEAVRRREDPLTAFRKLERDDPARDALKALRRTYPQLSRLSPRDALLAVEGVEPGRKRGRGNKSASVALARLAVTFRFLGARLEPGDTFEDAVHRVLRRLSEAWTRAPKRSRRK